jgi:glycosyltransferase involved in cell wall biosynthesis
MEIHLVVPAGLDEASRPSGGNVYDRRLRDALRADGHAVRQHEVPGRWPRPTPDDSARLDAVLAGLPEDAAVLVDGLLGCAAAEVVAPACGRLRVTMLVHLPLGAGTDEAAPDAAIGEARVLRRSAAVITTSGWSRDWLISAYALEPRQVSVAHPGVDPADLAVGTPEGQRLLCVATVRRAKGHDVLADALAELDDLAWHCTCVGPTDVEPDFVAALGRRTTAAGVEGRLDLVGARTGDQLSETYAATDLLVVPSRGETFGMVVSEALARGIPVVAAEVGGVSEALGLTPGSGRPGLLTPPGDSAALASALRRWLEDPALRSRLRLAAVDRRSRLQGWPYTARLVQAVLTATIRRSG